jgi:hypothetical protein
MNTFHFIYIFYFIYSYIQPSLSDAVCTEQMWINELIQDIAYNGKLDCLRNPLPAPEIETAEEQRKRLEAAWDTDCAFEASYDWYTPLKEKFKLTKGLVDVNGNPVPYDFKDQADMCEIARALIANGVLKDVNLNDLNENSFRDLSCPGNYNEIGICAVSGGSAAQSYAWYILLEGKGIQINGYPQWELTKKSKEIIEGKRIN